MANGKGVDTHVRMEGHEPTGECEGVQSPPSSFGGLGRLSDESPPVSLDDDAELDRLAEVWYNRTIAHFEALAYVSRPRRRRFNDYSAKNCEEAYGGR